MTAAGVGRLMGSIVAIEPLMLRQIKDYTLTRTLSESAVGATYLALDKRRGREVLVKIVSARDCEARTSAAKAAAVEHPALLRMIELDRVGEELLLVQQKPDAPPLADITARFEGDYRRIAFLIRECALALAVLHEQGVTHGDLNLNNILVSDDDVPILAEWGVGLAMHAPRDASPEAVERKQTLDQRADLFALGCVMYRLLSGEPATDQPAAVLSDPFSKHDDVAPIDSVAPEAPTELRAICSQALSTDPVHRYSDASVLVRDLDAYLFGKRRRPWVKAAFIIAGAAMVGLFGIWGTVGGGPARIVQASLERAAEGADESDALAADADYGVTVRLTKRAYATVIYRKPDGEVEVVERASGDVISRLVHQLPYGEAADRKLWPVGGRGGVGVLVVISHSAEAAPIDLIKGVLASAGEPPRTFTPETWYGDHLPSAVEPEVFDSSSGQSPRFKTVREYAQHVRGQLQRRVDDVAVCVMYIVGL